jgi:hypothetical protein
LKESALGWESKVQKRIFIQFDVFELWCAALGAKPLPDLGNHIDAAEGRIYSVAIKGGTPLPYPLTANYLRTRSRLEAINVRHDVLAGNVRLMQLGPGGGPWRINPFLWWRSFWEQSEYYIYAEDDPERFESLLDRQLGNLFDFRFWRGPTFSPDEITGIF